MPCPPDSTLDGYLNDALLPAEAARLSLHVDGCAACQSALERLTSGSVVVERYQKATSVIRAPLPESGTPPPAGGAYQTQMLGSEGIPLVPRIEPIRPQLPGYVITDEIGRGGMGVVYRAEQKRLNRAVALKLILAGGLADPRVTQRFLFEGEVLARVKHPQVVEVYEVGMHTAPTGVSFPYLAMELLDHGTLHGWGGGGRRSTREAAELIEGLARAVHAAHLQGVIHRDLKPANILRGADGRYKVSDFGLAKLVQESSVQLTGTGTVVGTPAYMAPEQAAGAKAIGPPADVYSLGAVLFDLLTGRPPFPGQDGLAVMLRVLNEPPPSVRSVRADVPRDLTAVIGKCLAKEPHRRYPSAEQLADDLKRFREDRPTRARPHTATERVSMWVRRNPAVASLLACLAAVMATAFISAVVLWQKAESTAADREAARKQAARLADVAAGERDETARQRREALRSAAYLAFAQADRQCLDGQVDDGLAGFVRALELAEQTDDAELARVIRHNLKAWQAERLPAARRFAHSPDGVVRATGFSPGGEWVLTAGNDGLVRAWEADTRKPAGVFTTRGGPADPFEQVSEQVRRLAGTDLMSSGVRAVAANRDRTLVAACTSAGTVLVWRVKDSPDPLPPGVRVRPTAQRFRFPDLWAVGFAPDDTLWVGGDYGVIEHLDAAGKSLGVITPPLPPGYDPADKKAVDRVARHNMLSVQCLRVGADGKRVFAGDRSGRVIEYDAAGGGATTVWGAGGWVTAVDVAADGNTVAFTSTGGRAEVHTRPKAGGGWQKALDLDLFGAYGQGVAVTGDGRWAAAVDEDGKVRVREVLTGASAPGLLNSGAELRRIAFRPGTRDLLLAQGGEVRLQPLLRPTERPMPVPNPSARVRALDFRPTDGGELLAGSGRLFAFDPAAAAPRPLPDLGHEPLAAVYSADGSRVLFGRRGGWGVLAGDPPAPRGVPFPSVYVNQLVGRPTADRVEVFVSREFQRWTGDGGRCEFSLLPDCLKNRDNGPAASLLSPDRTELRLAVGDGIAFADAATGRATRPTLRATDDVYDLAQTADGGRVFAALRDTTVQGWEVGTGKPLYPTPPRHALAVLGVAARPDGSMLLSGSRDHTARFWDGATGLPLGPPLRHATPVTKVALAPDGNSAATGTADGRVSVWPVPPPPDPAPVDELKGRFAADPDAGGRE